MSDKELTSLVEREENRRAIDSINAQARTKPLTVAQTILQQLGGNRFIAMTGAHNLIDDGNALSFKIGRNYKNVNQVKITLNALDLYDMEFGKKRGVYHRHTSAENIDADNLQRVFTMHTGMDTHL